jgi:hypothetical protein
VNTKLFLVSARREESSLSRPMTEMVDLASGRVCHETQLTEASMTAQVATPDGRLWARERQDRSIRNGSIVPETASDKPQAGRVQFDCGYLSPYFVTDPEWAP